MYSLSEDMFCLFAGAHSLRQRTRSVLLSVEEDGEA